MRPVIATKLGLGTVQFGLDYGVTNAAGKTPSGEVARILADAHDAGLRLLDTASLYGESEEALGRAFPAGHAFRIVTKTPKFTRGFSAAEARTLEDTFAASLRKLGVPRVYGLLAHQADDLLGSGGDRFLDTLLELKARGLVEKVGASIYSPAQVDGLLALGRPDLIQVPFNVLDQRLLRGGQLRALQDAGVEVHARSVFLQGVILAGPGSLPAHLSALEPVLVRFRAAAAACRLSPIQAALAFACGRAEVSTCLVGVVNRAQLAEIVAAAAPAGTGTPDWEEFHCGEERYVNPALWGKAA